MNAPRSALPRSGLIAAVDIGSTKTVCFVVRADDNAGLRVVGIGCQASRGVQAGSIVNMEAAEQSIAAAVNAAEEMAGDTLRQVWINVSDGQPRSRSVAVDVTIAGHEVGDADLRRVMLQSRQAIDTVDRTILHAMPVRYSIDGNRSIRDPRGMTGQRLGVNIHLVTAADGPLSNIESCISRCHLDVAGRASTPYASALASLVKDEMDLGVTVIDMGGGTTTAAVFFDGDCIHVDGVPIGGQHVTNDVARVLSTPAEKAERLKTLYGNAVGCVDDEREMIDVPMIGEGDGNTSQVPRSMLTSIIRPRVEETLEMIRSQLVAAGLENLGGRRLVLTGGASQLHGVCDLAGQILDKQVRIGQPIWLKGLAQATSGPAFTTCAGLLRYGAGRHDSNELEFSDWAHAGGLMGRFGRLGQWLRENL
ncbi:MAG: cell division protein FtsA [Rhodospirillaceae bacterium]|nr:cell division protein FtsA [Rhodospirillaceae bacterium]|tara:strand:+ start:2536 stop:3798 length:1263 start_codon:yes stop_codon:yes gene_type:complete